MTYHLETSYCSTPLSSPYLGIETSKGKSPSPYVVNSPPYNPNTPSHDATPTPYQLCLPGLNVSFMPPLPITDLMDSQRLSNPTSFSHLYGKPTPVLSLAMS